MPLCMYTIGGKQVINFPYPSHLTVWHCRLNVDYTEIMRESPAGQNTAHPTFQYPHLNRYLHMAQVAREQKLVK